MLGVVKVQIDDRLMGNNSMITLVMATTWMIVKIVIIVFSYIA